jgi:histidinol-phosphate aminotransferase
MNADQEAGLTTARSEGGSVTRAYLERGRRLFDEVDPYLPGLTREKAAALAKTTPERIAKLSSNENPLGPSPQAIAAVEAAKGMLHEYPSPTADGLRAALGDYLEVAPEQVVVGAGSSTLMHSIVDAFTSAGGEIISLDPGFTVYPEIATIHGRKPRQVALRKDDFLLDLNELARTITPSTQLIFLTRPNNPTSTLIPLEDFAEAARMGAEVGALVVSDEAYIEFSDIPGQSAVELLRRDPETYHNVLFTRTMSKAFGLANLRLGYAAASPEVAGCLALANAKWPTGAVAQAAGVAAVRDRDHLRKTLETVSHERRRMVAAFEKMGLPVAPSPQGNYVMVDVSPSGLLADAFSEKVFDLGQVLIRGDFSERYVRISIGRDDENDRLFEAVAKLMGTPR